MATFLIFSDDWGRHPSSCQHLTRCLMKNPEHRVFWVNTIGTRPPGFNLLTLRRGLEKILSWLSVFGKNKRSEKNGQKKKDSEKCKPETVSSPCILHPIMFPWFRTRFDRWLNRHLLCAQLKRALKGEKDVVGITTLPIVADLVGVLPQVSRWVYYCVDDWSRWPGMDAKPLAKMEADLLPRVQKVVSAGENLQDRLRSLGRDSLLLTHGVELDFWRRTSVETASTPGTASTSETALTPETASNPKTASTPETTSTVDSFLAGRIRNPGQPVFVFWGLVDERLEPAMLQQLAQDAPESLLLLAGPTASQEVVRQLEAIPNVQLLGRIPYDQLPVLASEADVLLMPYRKNEATEQIQPLKMTEYLASGKPAVVRDLRAAQEWSEALDTADSPESFSRLARLRVQTGLPETQRLARERLNAETWDEKAAQFERYIMTPF